MVKQVLQSGYKQTEVGIIPEDWKMRTLEDVLLGKQLGGNYQNSEEETSYPLIKMGNIGRGNIELSKIEYVRQNITPSERDELHYGDVLFNTRNTLDLVGKVAIWKNELPLAYFNSNLMRLTFNSRSVSNFFINYLFNSKNLLTLLKSIAVGTTSVAAIYTKDLLKIEIPVPELEEQIAISKILSDTDALIESLDKLIEKKKNIKRGAMQNLLTGKKRLPEFRDGREINKFENSNKIMATSEDWEDVQLKEITLQIIVPMRDKPKFFRGTTPWCRIEDFNGKYLSDSKSGRYVDKEIVNNMNLKIFPTDTLLVSCSADLGRCAIVKRPLVTNQTFIGLVIDDSKADNEFLYYYMTFHAEELNSLSSGTTISYLSREQFETLKVKVPKSKIEQSAIARVLTDMDIEIEKLEQKRDKYKQLKIGLMQQLLTGKVRLKWKS